MPFCRCCFPINRVHVDRKITNVACFSAHPNKATKIQNVNVRKCVRYLTIQLRHDKSQDKNYDWLRYAGRTEAVSAFRMLQCVQKHESQTHFQPSSSPNIPLHPSTLFFQHSDSTCTFVLPKKPFENVLKTAISEPTLFFLGVI